jgi:Family of unknown function (DUF6325)
VSIGPVEYIAIAFPGNKFSGEIIPALQELQDSGTIRILDLVIIHKDENGDITGIDLSEASPEEAAVLSVLGVEGTKLLGIEDVEEIGGALDDNSSAALMIWENVWASRFAESLRNAGGILIANGRIPAPLVEEAMAELTAS